MALAQYYPSVTMTAALSLFKYALQGCVGQSQVDPSYKKLKGLVLQKGLFGPYLMEQVADTVCSFKAHKEHHQVVDPGKPVCIESCLLPPSFYPKNIAEYASVLSWYMPGLPSSFKGTM